MKRFFILACLLLAACAAPQKTAEKDIPVCALSPDEPMTMPCRLQSAARVAYAAPPESPENSCEEKPESTEGNQP